MLSRRRFLQGGALLAAGILIPALRPESAAARRKAHGRRPPTAPLPGGSLDPTTIPKFVTPLVIPPAMPRTSELLDESGTVIDYYEIGVRQFAQHILPESMGLPATTVWGYGSLTDPTTFNYPAYTINAVANRPVRVKWVNDLKDGSGKFLPHLFAVDQTIHWANPGGGEMHRDHHTLNPAPYTGPVPLVPHVHGAHVSEESDGYTAAWVLPDASNIPAGYARGGTFYDHFKAKSEARLKLQWEPGTHVGQYPNQQRAATLWYHDHALGMTRLNVYAGPAGFWLVRGGPDDLAEGVLPGPLPQEGEAAGTKHYEFPVVIQDRSFNADGSLFYPDGRAFFDGFTGPYIPDSDMAPIWNPEFFGNTMVVNGQTWPLLEVEPRRYRMRLLNGCNSRFLILKLAVSAGTPPPIWQIGSDGGLLPAPVALDELLLAPAERADVILDFSGLAVGDEIDLRNLAPDEPYGGGVAGVDFIPADPNTTGQVMRFRVIPLVTPDTSTPPAALTLPVVRPIGVAPVTRQVSLNEAESNELHDVGPRAAFLGMVTLTGNGDPMMFGEAITEDPLAGVAEVWEIYNFTMDAHPIHVHQVMFEVVNREIFHPGAGTMGTILPSQANEAGWKDTVIAYPGTITRIKLRFDIPGLYVWHCHIIEHEDNEMMRPLYVRTRITLPWVAR
jgi:bilirubin oxidase